MDTLVVEISDRDVAFLDRQSKLNVTKSGMKQRGRSDQVKVHFSVLEY